ncbi:AEC family transporter [Pedobacter sp. HDW13]|uniref:AEC family transporter n=1 Tax=unclassified Pedobacter TaxID=2628915 RepID=UPI000F5AB5F0|nr:MULTISPECIES: AEC family transporter [unclassified Pedobacter]QIL39601.1 AEC family transporter [Pedobacter sp. HDW13]RQO78512.1 transporter [Pedobacter sp. KBW01]
MANFIIIGLCILAGILFRKSKTLPKDAHKGINAWIIYIALPAASFKYLPHIVWTKDLLFPVLAPICVWLFGWLFVTVYSRSQKLSRATTGGLKLTSSLSNTSFLGFPLIAAYFSEKDQAIAIICDQATFMLLSTIGIVVAIRSSQNQKLSAQLVLKKVLTFPPLIGCILALTVPHFITISPLEPLFEKLAGTVGPLALFSIGLQLKFGGWFSELKHISFTLLYKLILAPVVVLAIAVLLGLSGTITRITIFEMAMPTLVTAGVVADQYNLNPKLANLVVGVGIVLCFVTTGLWWLVLTYSGLV